MAYFRKCGRCGALRDPGEVGRREETRARLAAVPAPVVIHIEDKPTMAEKERECDRALWLALKEYRAAKAARGRKRRR